MELAFEKSEHRSTSIGQRLLGHPGIQNIPVNLSQIGTGKFLIQIF